MSDKPKEKTRIRKACSIAKIELTSSDEAEIYIESLIKLEDVDEREDFVHTISRSLFENLSKEIFERCFTPLDRAIAASGFSKDEFDEVIIVGGSTRIPMIRKMLSEYFGGKELNLQLHPDEAIATGATIKAGMLSKQHSELQGI